VIVERPTVEHRVTSSLDAGRIPVVLGTCGSGRTSLLLRLETLLGLDASQYLDFAAAATTPERCVTAIMSRSRLHAPDVTPNLGSPQLAFEGLLTYFDRVGQTTPGATFLLDEFLDVRTFESFPGLRHVQREMVDRLAASPSRFVLASRFTARVHRLLRDAPSRFEVIHMPALETAEVHAMAQRFDAARQGDLAEMAPAVTQLAGGLPGAAHILLAGLSSMSAPSDPVAALGAALAPDGALTARCRECYELRLHRARGYGALKAILGVLADTEPLTLTEISHQLRRTPGSTKDYLSWLEDVDLITVRAKKYTFTDPLLRVYVRLYGHPVPPTDDDVVREVGHYAKSRLPSSRPLAAPAPQAPAETSAPASVAPQLSGEAVRSGIIEID
jgi:hypothetical protein